MRLDLIAALIGLPASDNERELPANGLLNVCPTSEWHVWLSLSPELLDGANVRPEKSAIFFLFLECDAQPVNK